MNEVKLVIWDLDDTLWQGTLADNEYVILNQDVVDKIHFLLNRGIVHSICSKNDEKKAEQQLKQFGIRDLFVFPNISFDDKGMRVKTIIEQAQLRPQNVLFVDDNPFVLREITFHNPLIMTCLIDDFLKEDISQWGKKDEQRKRLAHYKLLEKKEQHKRRFLENNNDEQAFLKKCDIHVQLLPLHMDDPDVERVIELVNRSNQMNFTKSRIKYEYLFTLFELKNGLNFKIKVHDHYGDYGIVGYVCVLNDTLLHFVFSCRTLGMCVESRTYQWINEHYPHLKKMFDTACLKQIHQNLDFITITTAQNRNENPMNHHDKKILVRGPCMANAISFLLHDSFQVEEEIFSFFEYANLHFFRHHFDDKNDERFKKTHHAIEHGGYSAIVNFLESDYYSGHYMIHRQLTPIASNYIFWQSLRAIKQDNPLLSQHLETMILDGMRNLQKFNIGPRFSPWPRLEKAASATMHLFGENWRKLIYYLMLQVGFRQYQGYVQPHQFEENLAWYVDLFSEKTPLIFILPPKNIPLPLLNAVQNEKIMQRTKALNQITRTIAQKKPNMILLEMDQVLNEDDIIDSFSHLKREGYVKLSQALLQSVNAWTHHTHPQAETCTEKA